MSEFSYLLDKNFIERVYHGLEFPWIPALELMRDEEMYDLILIDLHLENLDPEDPSLKKPPLVKKIIRDIRSGSIRLQNIASYFYHAITNVPVLIVGETGTSKETIAKLIHRLERRDKPFYEINCAAIPSLLLQSELFGHAKGAFTDAITRKDGLLKLAHGGTCFLDELGKMPQDQQAKLLKAIEEEKITPIGEKEPIEIDVRYVSAAQPGDLENILPDLIYRLGFPDVIRMPTLNERLNKIGPIIFRISLENVLGKMKVFGLSLNPNCYDILGRHQYAGNYRELEGILRGAIISALINNREEILPEDLRPLMKNVIPSSDANRQSKEQERLEVEKVPVKDIIQYADRVRAEIVEYRILDIYKSGKELKPTLLNEGLPKGDYQKFTNQIRKVTGKSVNQIRKEAKGNQD